jgi:hypothetical protein
MPHPAHPAQPARSPRQRGRRTLGLAAAVTVASLVASSGLPALAAPAAARTGTASPGPAARGPATTGPASPGTGRSLLLINGDRLLVRSAGGRTAVAVRRGTGHYALTSLRLGRQVMEIPTVALPYLGRGLDPRLFELSALEQAESRGRLPVEVTFAGRRPAVPGLTVTRSSAGSVRGYFTASSAGQFGAALQRQYGADHSRGRYGRDGLFSGDVSISLPGAVPPPAPGTRPAFKMHTLTVDGTNLRGRPDTGDDVFLASADSLARFLGFQENDNFFYHGTAKFSVPAGHYWAFVTFMPTGASPPHLVVLPQFTVEGQHAVVHVAEKAASSEVTVATPRPVAPDAQSSVISFTAVRTAADGSQSAVTDAWSGPGWVSPTTRRPTVGRLASFTLATLGSPPAARPGYVYNLDFPGPPGVISRQHFVVGAAGLASVTERYYQDVPTDSSGWITFGGTAFELNFELQPVFLIRMPQVQTQYFATGGGIVWSNETFANANLFSGGDADDYRAYSAGQHQRQDWNNYPLHPAADTSLGGEAGQVLAAQVSAARTGNTLGLDLSPFTDNQFGHLGAPFGNGSATVTGSYQVDQNGTEISHGGAVNGIPGITLSSRPSVIRLVLNAARWSSFYQLSPSSRTVWTWRSVRDTAATVPSGWYCADGFQRCAVQPLMTLTYRVAGMSLTGRTRAGPQVIDVTAGHIQLARAAAITGASAQVSDNDGETWQPGTVTAQGHGRFRVAYTAPAGVDVTLRVTAADAAGGSVTETILRAYGVSS